MTLEEARLAQVTARVTARVNELQDAAEEARKGPDPTKKAMRKLARMAKGAAALRAQLEAEGVDLSELEI
mgnify:FL=1